MSGAEERSSFDPGRAVLDRLLEEHFTAVEVYVKHGRSRRFEWSSGAPANAPRDSSGEITIAAEEAGWAVRAGARSASFFYAAAGRPAPLERWPVTVEGERLELPRPSPVAGFTEAPEAAEPLLAEEEGWALLRRLTSELARRFPHVAVDGVLDDGASDARIWNHHGLDARHRGRFASLRLELRASGDETLSQAGTASATLVVGARSARRLPLASIGDRVEDLLSARGPGSLGGASGAEVSGDMVLAPEVVVRLLEPLAGAFVDRQREEVLALLDAAGGERVGSQAVTLIDDASDARGLAPAPIDGEGLLTVPRVLVEAGRMGSTVMPWERSGVAAGSRTRASWRDLPRVALSQCFVVPASDVDPLSLLAEAGDGFYLLDAGDGGGYDLRGGSFSLPVWGFRIASGRVLHPLGAAILVGDPRRLLHGVCGAARDLRFSPLGAMIGAPTLLVRGLALRPH